MKIVHLAIFASIACNAADNSISQYPTRMSIHVNHAPWRHIFTYFVIGAVSLMIIGKFFWMLRTNNTNINAHAHVHNPLHEDYADTAKTNSTNINAHAHVHNPLHEKYADTSRVLF